tara:strand:+ start:266 stop:613 length:348 start_codon:yes stop_codon:yes gene_type:complete
LRKLLDFFSSEARIETDHETKDNYDYVLIEIIDDVIKKRKDVHKRYDRLVEKVWVSARPIKCKTFLAKYLLGRLLRESDRIFAKGQTLATRLCPKCNQYSDNHKNVFLKYSNKTH